MPAEVTIHPFGGIDDDLVEAVRAAVEDRFRVTAVIGERLVVPARAYAPKRDQYRSTVFLDDLSRLGRREEQVRIGIAAVDLFVPDLNFVFGEASTTDGLAVFSIARLDPRKYGEGADKLLLAKRAVVEAIHELGHVYGLGHCRRQNCVMWFSNTLAETDRKGSNFCTECARQLGKTGSGFTY